MTTVTSLATKNAREQWENIFNQNYIQPVLQVAGCWFPANLHDSAPHIEDLYLKLDKLLFLLLCLSPLPTKELEQRLTKVLHSILMDDKQGMYNIE